MRKALILTTMLAGIGGLVAAAQASQDKVPKDASQVTPQTESLRSDGEGLGAPQDERSHEARERSRDEHREAHEEAEDDDQD